MYFADQLGSTRTITTGSGKNADGSAQTPGLLCYDQDYTPYGQEIFSTMQMTRLQTTACPTNYKFTGYERDSETGLDYAFARYYSSRLGRFLSTDPLGGGVGDLQSHNAYAYTHNNPLNMIDPSGAVDCHPEEACWIFGGGNFWDGNPYIGLGGGGGRFDLLLLAFTPTQSFLGVITQNNEPVWAILNIYGNWDLLGLLNFASTARDFQQDFYRKYQAVLNNCIKGVFKTHAQDVLPQTIDNAPALNVSKSSGGMADMCNYHGAAPIGCHSVNPAPNGTIFIASEKFNAGGSSALANNINTYVHELGNLLDHKIFPNTPVDSQFYESHFPGTALNLNDPDTGANLADCFEKARKAAEIQ